MTFIAWSNAAYPLAGLLSGQPVALIVLSWLGVCSYLYHSKRVPWGGFADVASMYAAFSGLLVLAWFPLYAFPVAVIVFAYTFRSMWWQANLPYKIPPLWALWVGSIALHAPDWRFFLAGVGCYALGGVAWLLDPKYEKVLHGAWHVLTAAGSLFLLWARPVA